MALPWAQKNLSPISIDFGADSLKLLQISTDEPPHMVAAAALEIPQATRKDRAAYGAFVTQALKQLLRQGKFKGKRAVASISASSTYVQHIRLPKGELADIEPQLEGELRGRLPMDPSQMVLRHVPVGEVFADGVAKQEIICMAASREVVMQHVLMARGAGLNVVGMHCEPMAVMAAFSHLFRRVDDANRTTLFIDMGCATTKVMIAHGLQLVFAKNIEVAGEHFTHEAARFYGLGFAETRLHRIEIASTELAQAQEAAARPGEVKPARLPRAAQQMGSPLAAAQAAMRAEQEAGGGTAVAAAVVAPPDQRPVTAAPEDEMLDCLLDELQLCVGYHGSTFPDRNVEKIVFLGGEARHIEMCQRIAAALRLPAQLGDPLARLSRGPGGCAPVGLDLRHGQPGWAVPLGLCLLPTNL
ncbi:MAG: pilus assembly protein PilM [Phycisphaerae bacterium]|nr:pilus assembly protein PilM [Phycisphaerae bacterium]